MYVYMYVCVYVCICMYLCMNEWIYLHCTHHIKDRPEVCAIESQWSKGESIIFDVSRSAEWNTISALIYIDVTKGMSSEKGHYRHDIE